MRVANRTRKVLHMGREPALHPPARLERSSRRSRRLARSSWLQRSKPVPVCCASLLRSRDATDFTAIEARRAGPALHPPAPAFSNATRVGAIARPSALIAETVTRFASQGLQHLDPDSDDSTCPPGAAVINPLPTVGAAPCPHRAAAAAASVHCHAGLRRTGALVAPRPMHTRKVRVSPSRSESQGRG